MRLDGSTFDAAELAGRVVLLDFWGSWCPPCIQAFPKLGRLHAEFAERGFLVLGLAVKSGTPEEVATFLAEHDVSYPNVLIELDVPDRFGVLAYPTYVLIGADGEVLDEFHGIPTDLYEQYAAQLEALLPPSASP